MSKTISFHTLGCRSNQSETAVLKNLFSKDGYKIVKPDTAADVAVINTCTVTEKGDSDTRKLVSRINRTNPSVKIALIGCQAQTQGQELSILPNVRWIVGNAEKMSLVNLIHQIEEDELVKIITPPIKQESFTVPAPGIDDERTRANIKIQEGCDSFCTFCEVPYARGQARSREFEDILKEAKELVDAGYKELVLTGTNIGVYHDKSRGLVDVVTALEKYSALERIRVSSIEPNAIPYDLALLMGTKTKLCRHLHLPLQSASDEIIERMGRRYTQKELSLFLKFASKNIQGVCLGADIIVGFPGETERHFEETYMFLEDSPLVYFHTFSYSNRKFAKSRKLGAQVDKTIIARRSKSLRNLGSEKKKAFLKQFVGTYQKVLFEERKEGAWSGLTDNYLRVQTHSSQNLRNRVISVTITEIKNDILLGEMQ
ncbi:MAG: tRNA (N(6)-L-threonylcarbamoyladenosine(37)-C(2))-methylthiotransferase MtaB [Candidatus Aceula meridiana]|nr:tRNA (N(6)-L-threonylcarbamoyladenosine(37)-C(2))-methylthiotransferase MtaB [Candidatus Aceula meridiana]